jgi:hypothetical protein
MKLFRSTIILWLALAFLVVPVRGAIAKVSAQPPDVGLVTSLSGTITYWNDGYQEAPATAQAFMKIRRGDRFKLGEGAVVQLVYFLGGRQETWKGPVTLAVGDSESHPEGQEGVHAQPGVVVLPAGTTQGVRRIPTLLRRAGLTRPGATQVRGDVAALPTPVPLTPEEKAEIAGAKETYQSIRKQTDPGDITPELYLLGVLTDYEQYSEMGEVIREALKRQPDNDILKGLMEWVLAQSSQGRRPSTK